MNKTEIIDSVSTSTGMSKMDTARVVNALLEEITKALAKPVPETVTFVGFGTFKVTQREERSGRNPQTGQTITIPAQKTPRFSAGKQLKEACNEDKK
ncbi:MAG: HU family DNA-binding protein [Gammaproteobacteria bacterium]|nr:HU family DNA-binding protein [Gammaproteobacteria bacterium]